MATNLTNEARDGWRAEMNRENGATASCPYLATSASWFAFKVGEWLRRTGRSEPRDVRMGRGYQVHVNDMLVAFDAHNAITRIR